MIWGPGESHAWATSGGTPSSTRLSAEKCGSCRRKLISRGQGTLSTLSSPLQNLSTMTLNHPLTPAIHSYWPSPPQEVIIPHKHAIKGEGHSISAFVRVPAHASASSPVPCTIMITGLDGFKCDVPPAVTNFQFNHGWGYVAVEIPGSGDSPALRNDPTSPDRTWSSVLDWIEESPVFDNRKIAAWGLSTGGYYALRIAHTHKERLRGVIAQGAGCHKAFDPEWMRASDDMEYPMR